MPKRKNDCDLDEISKELRKLKRKLKRAKQKGAQSLSDENVNIEPSAHNHKAAETSIEVDNDNMIEDPVRNITEPTLQSQDKLSSPQQLVSSAEGPATSLPANDVFISIDDDNEDLSEILGSDPTQDTEYGKDIHVGLSKRLEHIIVNGLDNETRKELGKKYLCPANCTLITPPLLNKEIKAALPELSVKRDKGMETRQKQVSVAITCLSDIISTLLLDKDKNQSLIKQLMDAVKLMCDSFHSDSTKRRYFALSSLKKDVNEHLMQTKIDKYLFGEGLVDTLKTAKAVNRSSDEIKANPVKTNNKKTAQSQPSTSRTLNWKAPPPARWQPGPQRSRQTYQPVGQRTIPLPHPPMIRPSSQHASSSRTSHYQPPRRRY